MKTIFPSIRSFKRKLQGLLQASRDHRLLIWTLAVPAVLIGLQLCPNDCLIYHTMLAKLELSFFQLLTFDGAIFGVLWTNKRYRQNLKSYEQNKESIFWSRASPIYLEIVKTLNDEEERKGTKGRGLINTLQVMIEQEYQGQETKIEQIRYLLLNFIGANLREAQLVIADLRGVYLVGANLSKANLVGVKLKSANLSGANLREANLWSQKENDIKEKFDNVRSYYHQIEENTIEDIKFNKVGMEEIGKFIDRIKGIELERYGLYDDLKKTYDELRDVLGTKAKLEEATLTDARFLVKDRPDLLIAYPDIDWSVVLWYESIIIETPIPPDQLPPL